MQKDGEIRWQNVYFVIFFVIFAVFLQVLRLPLQSYENAMNFILKYKIFVIVCYTICYILYITVITYKGLGRYSVSRAELQMCMVLFWREV